MLKIKDICAYLEKIAPLPLQESYDNAGLIVGNPREEVKGVLCTLDSTEEVVDEAIENGCNLIVAHHPIVFSGLKKLSGNSYIERTIIKAIKNDVAIYAIHTNLDNVHNGVNAKICEKLGLDNLRILSSGKEALLKLAVFVPQTHVDELLQALGNAGAGKIGDYQNCSFSTTGEGRFQPMDSANPFIGKAGGEIEKVKEEKIEVILPVTKKGKVLQAMYQAHPYEEVAFDIYRLENGNPETGSGMLGNLKNEMQPLDFLRHLKESMELATIKHTALPQKNIKKVAVCGGSGSFLLTKAMSAKADIFITSDYKYHQFFDADGKIVIADIGHFESEKYTRELLVDILTPKFKELTIIESKVNTNPINYF